MSTHVGYTNDSADERHWEPVPAGASRNATVQDVYSDVPPTWEDSAPRTFGKPDPCEFFRMFLWGGGVCVHVLECVSLCSGLLRDACFHECVCKRTYIYMYVHTHYNVFVCVCVCVYIYIYIYIYTLHTFVRAHTATHAHDN